MADALLELDELAVWLPTADGPARAVDGVSLSVAAGEVFGLAGESGSGKTMTAMSVLGLLPHGARATGAIRFAGQELIGAADRVRRDLRGREMAIVAQDPSSSLHPMLPVETLVTEHMRHHLGVTKTEAHGRAVQLLDTVRIPDPEQALRRYAGQFSGGMRQRIAIAVALACDPRLLLADEPTTALDVTVQAGILRLIDRLRRERGLAVVLITHDLGVMSAIADRVGVMYGGRLVETGTCARVLGAPRHPYTRGLLDALPDAGGDDAAAEPMRPISGAPPALGARPHGCPFHPRCAFARRGCRGDVPPLQQVEPGVRLACVVDPWRPR